MLTYANETGIFVYRNTLDKCIFKYFYICFKYKIKEVYLEHIFTDYTSFLLKIQAYLFG